MSMFLYKLNLRLDAAFTGLILLTDNSVQLGRKLLHVLFPLGSE